MLPPLEAAKEFHTFLTAQSIPYAILGGIAVQIWGESRVTQDLDLTVVVPPERAEAVMEILLARFVARTPDALDFARRRRVLLLSASNGVSVDVSLGVPGYEDDVLARAVPVAIAPGCEVRFCCPEDLVIHKAVAGRTHDRRDIETVIARQKGRLDVAYIRRWLGEFANLLAKPDPVDIFEAALSRVARYTRPDARG